MWLMDSVCKVMTQLLDDFADLVVVLGSGCLTNEAFKPSGAD
jgi:hypothetical protein